MKNLLAFLCICLSIQIANAASLIDYHFINDQIIVLHISEGFVDHYDINQTNSDNVMFKSALDVNAATNTSNYTLNYLNCANGSSNSILEIGRKAKAADINGDWSNPDFVLEHWIYLKLDCPMMQNEWFEINFQNDIFEETSLQVIYNQHTSNSSAIHVNNIGFVPISQKKYGYVSAWLGDLGPMDFSAYEGNSFHLIDLSNLEIAFTGTLNLRKDLETGGPDIAYGDDDSPYGNFAGADVYECDFSSFQTNGNYVLSVEGIGCSNPFFIHPDVYYEPYYVISRALYHHRSGTEIDSEFSDYPRPRDHHPAETDTVILSDWRYKDGLNAFEELPLYATEEKQPFWGGWHDAGDWDRNHNHLEGASALMLTYELNNSNFFGYELDIPEYNNQIPDIIDEAKWVVDFFKRSQNEEGAVIGGLETTQHPDSGVSSPNDPDQWYAYAPDPCANFHYAAVAAQLAQMMFIINDIDLMGDYFLSALDAFNWAQQNTTAEEQEEVRDYRQLAAAYLYKLTGGDAYQDVFEAMNMITTENTPLYEYQSHDQQRAAWAYATTWQGNLDEELHNTIREACINWAISDNINSAEMRSSRMGYHWWAPTGWGTATTPKNTPLMVAYFLTGDQQFLDYQFTTADYFLGGNPLNMTWATQLGEVHPKQVLHLDSWYYNDGDVMVPGIVPYGPMRYNSESNPNFWNPEYGMNTCYPNADDWPSHELWFNNRYCAPTNEYTTWQTIAPAAAAYAALTSENQNIWPTVEIIAPAFDEVYFENPGSIQFNSEAKDWDGNVISVEYFVRNQSINGPLISIGESFISQFSLSWTDLETGAYSVVAKATDNVGAVGYSAPINIFINAPVNTDNLIETHIQIAPNPTQDVVRIKLNKSYEQIQMSVSDLSGKKVEVNTFYNIVDPIDLDLSDFPSGVYLLELKENGILLHSEKLVLSQQ